MLRSIILLLSAALCVMCGAAEKDILRETAAGGDRTAQFRLGTEYFYGTGGRRADYTLAAYWYKKAAEQNLAEAQFNYGLCLDRGAGVDRDPFLASDYYRKAAEQGFEPAMYNHALVLLHGIEIRNKHDAKKMPPGWAMVKEEQKAISILENLANKGFVPAVSELAEYFLRTKRGNRARMKQTFDLLKRASEKKNPIPRVLSLLADCYYGGIGTEPDTGKAISLLERASEGGSTEAMAKLAYCLEHGVREKVDTDRVFRLYKRAALGGLPMAQLKYGDYIADGREPGMGLDNAMEWYRKSAAGNCPQGLFKLGVMTLEGVGTEKNPKAAAELFFRAAKLGYPRAQYNLACMFLESDGPLTRDESAAFYWFMRGAERKDAACQRRVALAYLRGEGVEKSRIKGAAWLREAAANGDAAAMNLLEREGRWR